MSLLDKYLPVYQFSERHDVLVDGPPRAVLDAVQAYDRSGDRFVQLMTTLREWPGRMLTGLGFTGTSRTTTFAKSDFVPLDRDGDREMAAGLAGRFWRLNYGLVPLADAAAFEAFAKPGNAKLVLGFLAEPRGDQTHLVTETRVYCPDRISLLRFTPYWLVIRLPSGLIRRRFLNAVKRTVESQGMS